jgi:nitronate monooxygenase
MAHQKSEALQRLGIDHPIVQGPFGGGLSTALLTATVSNMGGLGSYGAHVVAPDRIGPLADEIRALTARPFALNLWVSDHDPGGLQVSEAEFERVFGIFAPYFDQLGLAKPERPEGFHHSFEAQAEALIEARPPVFSFVFGVPRPAILAECKRRSIVTVGAATSITEALALEGAGVDLIVATGFEAGGHRPSFLARAEDSLFGTFALVQLVAER